MAASDYYTLGLSPGATPKQILAAYRQLAFKYHPDYNPGREAWAAEQFKKVNQAYEALTGRSAQQRMESFQRQQESARIVQIRQMAEKGAMKMARRYLDIRIAYEEAKASAVAGYNGTPFNRQMKRNYRDSMQNAHMSLDPLKWRENWASKVL
jgi:DnaJ-class molecular chaperone